MGKVHELDLEVKEQASDTVEEGKVIEQSVAPKEKIAKRDAFQVTISLGKGVTVPDFSTILPDDAQAAVEVSLCGCGCSLLRVCPTDN